MLTTLSLSPCIDRRMEFDGFRAGATNRVVASRAEGAGKAVNVALAARALGMPARCVGILPAGGEMVETRLAQAGVPFSFLPAPGVTRVNLKLFDRRAAETTEVSEPCPEAPASLLSRAADAAAQAARESGFLVLTGSLPSGCPDAWYADMLSRVHAEAPGCRCVLDAEGPRFVLGLQARPFLVKPNLHELACAAGHALSTRRAILRAAEGLLDAGAQTAVVSLGAQGALAVDATGAAFAPALDVPVRTTTGAGDAMVAGLLLALAGGAGLTDALRHGTAAAAARCLCAGDAFLHRADFDALLPQTRADSL